MATKQHLLLVGLLGLTCIGVSQWQQLPAPSQEVSADKPPVLLVLDVTPTPTPPNIDCKDIFCELN